MIISLNVNAQTIKSLDEWFLEILDIKFDENKNGDIKFDEHWSVDSNDGQLDEGCFCVCKEFELWNIYQVD